MATRLDRYPSGGMSAPGYAQQFADFQAARREAMAPDPADPDSITRRCPGCGNRFTARKGSSWTHCARCAADRRVKAATQIEARSGPLYVKQLVGMYRYAAGELTRLGVELPEIG